MSDARVPVTTVVADGITAVDTRMAGFDELNAVYVIASEEPTLVEAGPGADGPMVVAALRGLGIGPGDLAHIVVTHVHLDHAGGAGALLERFPAARLWVHERGAPHVVDPSRLVASTSRTYGERRMRAFFGETRPCPAARVRAIADGDRIDLGDRELEVMFTPGHASHHVALMETSSGAMFTGEAIGSHLPWADCYRPALPPPEVDVEAALSSIDRMRGRSPSMLLTSHFGPIDDAHVGFDRGMIRIREWSERVRHALEEDPAITEDDLTAQLTELARVEYETDARAPFDHARYDAIGSIRMNAQGLGRYWRARPSRELKAASSNE
jgi:glyoxylase-like metal-dependent hydrolase (beta-lactamase superfamily II)